VASGTNEGVVSYRNLKKTGLKKVASTASTGMRADTNGIDEKAGETGDSSPSLFRRMIPKIRRKSTVGAGEDRV
jgi:hypothetical protein